MIDDKLMEFHNKNKLAIQSLMNTVMFANFTGVNWKHPVAQTSTNTKEEEMNTEFHTERQALHQDLRKSRQDHLEALYHKHHIKAHQPTTVREALKMLHDGHFDGSKDDKFLDRKYNSRFDGNPLFDITFREHEADHEGFEKDSEKLDAAFRSHTLKVATHEPTKAFTDVEKFRTTFH